MNGNKSLDRVFTNTFTKRGLLPGTEYSFRVRTIKGDSVSEWSDIVKGRTEKKTSNEFSLKECHVNVTENSNVCNACGKEIGSTMINCGGKRYHNMCFNCNFCGKNIGTDSYVPFKGLSFCSAKCLSNHKKVFKK